MNPETKKFEPVTKKTPKDWKIFEIGEEIILKGWIFKITYIRKDRMSLTPIREVKDKS